MRKTPGEHWQSAGGGICRQYCQGFCQGINDVGITQVFGMDNPELLENEALFFVKEHTMTPQKYIDELKGFEKHIFKRIYAGKFSKKLYRLFEYRKV